MATFAEIDSNNKVLRVVAACDTDVAAYGGDQSEKAAENFRRTVPLSVNGVKWVQTSSTFRGHRCNVGETFDAALNIFKGDQPYPSWTLNTTTGFYEAPKAKPEGDIEDKYFIWDEDLQDWKLDPSVDISV